MVSDNSGGREFRSCLGVFVEGMLVWGHRPKSSPPPIAAPLNAASKLESGAELARRDTIRTAGGVVSVVGSRCASFHNSRRRNAYAIRSPDVSGFDAVRT